MSIIVSTNIYIDITDKGRRLLQSETPKMTVSFPARTNVVKQKKIPSNAPKSNDDSLWINTKPSKKRKAKETKLTAISKESCEVISLLDSDGENEDNCALNNLSKCRKLDDIDSDGEHEFE